MTRQEDLTSLLGDSRPGDTIQLDVLRGGKHVQVPVKLGERPFEVGR